MTSALQGTCIDLQDHALRPLFTWLYFCLSCQPVLAVFGSAVSSQRTLLDNFVCETFAGKGSAQAVRVPKLADVEILLDNIKFRPILLPVWTQESTLFVNQNNGKLLSAFGLYASSPKEGLDEVHKAQV